jgi:hypothetical protein
MWVFAFFSWEEEQRIYRNRELDGNDLKLLTEVRRAAAMRYLESSDCDTPLTEEILDNLVESYDNELRIENQRHAISD